MCFTTALNALANEGLAHILAEPNLTVMSGQAGIVPGRRRISDTGAGRQHQSESVTIDFKPYGVLLSFVPTVMSDGRINLHVKPEVSQLDNTNTVSFRAAAIVDGLTGAPHRNHGRTRLRRDLRHRRHAANDHQQQSTSGLPGLGDTPISARCSDESP